MKLLHFPWLELAFLLPIVGALLVRFGAKWLSIRHTAIAISGLLVLCTAGEYLDFLSLQVFEAHDRWEILNQWFGGPVVAVDELSAPLMPFVALAYFLVVLSTPHTKLARLSLTLLFAHEALILFVLACKASWGITLGLALSMLFVPLELHWLGKPIRNQLVHAGLAILLMLLGLGCLSFWPSESGTGLHSTCFAILTLGLLVRCGCWPFHSWRLGTFEHGSLGFALVNAVPMLGVYGVMRLLVPNGPGWLLETLSYAFAFNAVICAGLALVQERARRFFAFLLFSHVSLVGMAICTATPLGMTGGLSNWLSIVLAMTGLGITIRNLEGRLGRLSLNHYYGLYSHAPSLAILFLITGLASIGFPGTIGFAAVELIVDGAEHSHPLIGVAALLVTALNGIGILMVYFRLFTGVRHFTRISLGATRAEKLSALIIVLLILAGGVFPQFGVSSRFHATREALRLRAESEMTELRPTDSNVVKSLFTPGELANRHSSDSKKGH